MSPRASDTPAMRNVTFASGGYGRDAVYTTSSASQCRQTGLGSIRCPFRHLTGEPGILPVEPPVMPHGREERFARKATPRSERCAPSRPNSGHEGAACSASAASGGKASAATTANSQKEIRADVPDRDQTALTADGVIIWFSPIHSTKP